jgi:hypothetical protein
MHDNTTGNRPTSPGASIDLRAQVLEMLCPTAALAKLADCVFHEPLLTLLLTKDTDLARCLVPGQWVHAVGRARFLFPRLVCALEMTSCEPIAEQEWGGAEYVGYEENLAPHMISARGRVMSTWRYYDEPDGFGDRRSGYTADLALPCGEDGTRALLHWWLGSDDCRIRGERPAIQVGDLVAVTAHLEWYPHQLCSPLPSHTPIFDLWDASNVKVVQR